MEYEFSRPVKVEHIDRKGTKENIEATSEELAILAGRLNVSTVKNLTAKINVEALSDRMTYYVNGTVQGEVEQESVISGDLVASTITADIEAWSVNHAHVASFEKEQKKRDEVSEEEEYEIKDEKDDPEVIKEGVIDIGEVAVQFFALNIEDYPKTDAEKNKSGDYIEVDPEEAKPNPFAKLAELKTKE